MASMLDTLTDQPATAPCEAEPSARHPPSPATGDAGSMATAKAATMLGSVLLAGCGGGGGGSSPATTPAQPSSPAPPTPVALPTQTQAARFLGQASFAATPVDLGTVTAQGYSAWLDSQFAMPPVAPTAYAWINTQPGDTAKDSSALADFAVWRRLISSPDPLRQRVVLALSEIMVISSGQINGTYPNMMAGAYWDMLEANAFGTFRQLMQAVSLSCAMGMFLNMRGSVKANPTTGTEPDENYAREVMQLFTIGLVQLNADGSTKLDANGNATYTYNQADVSALAAVFTGWNFDLATGQTAETDPAFTTRPMVNNAAKFSSGDKSVLGTAIPASADGPTALALALDVLCNHPNNGPFIGRQLIQRLVCSNPSPSYVARVSAVFNNNGKGVRGDLKAVITAVLLDPEARSPLPGPANGKLREPIVRFVQWARTFNLTSPSGLWDIADQSSASDRLGQSPLRSPSVFNFFAPNFVPANSTLGSNGITAPEFQICNETTVAGYLNFMQLVIPYGIGGNSGYGLGNASPNKPDYTGELSFANDPASLVARYNLLLAGGGLGADTVATIITAVTSVPVDPTNPNSGLLNRVWSAILLVMAAPDYLIQQ